jgi:DNA-binding Lrp family transcriptional regulator
MTVALERLLAQGEVYVDPMSVVVWEQADPDRPWFPAHMVSVPGLPHETMLKLSRLDLARLALTSVWLKGLTAAKVAEQGLLTSPATDTRLVLQELREEAGHALMFLRIAEMAGLSEEAVAGQTRRIEKLTRRLHADGPALWAWAYLGEAVTDALVTRALREGDDLCPVARQVMQLHHREQTRRMASCKAILVERLKRAGWLRRQGVAMLLPVLLRRYLQAMLFPRAASLAAVGVNDPHATARAVLNDNARRALASSCAAAAVTTLRRAGLPMRAGASYPW